MASAARKTLFVVLSVLLPFVPWATTAGAAPAFVGAADGVYDGPVSIVFTKENAPATPKLEDLRLSDSVSQYGITWRFDRKARVGRFVTGDWYVIGPVTVLEITPKPLFGQEVFADGKWTLINEDAMKEDKYKDAWSRNGSRLNPGADTIQAGFDSRIAHGFYNPKLATLPPVGMKPGDALISTISTPEPIKHNSHGRPIYTAAILTCLKDPVPVDAFRPSYCDRQQKMYLARNLKRELLYALPLPEAAPKELGNWARAFQRPWLDTVSWGFASPIENLPQYGQLITRGISTGALLLHLAYPPIEKERLLVHYVQYGIDLWGIVRAGYTGWPGHGGFGGGRKWALIFGGLMLGDDEMRAPSKAFPDCRFGEDDQTSWGETWTGHKVAFESHPIRRKVPTELKHPSEWETDQSEGYRRCCTSVEWPGQALAARMMRAEKYWDHAPFFAYVDRWMTEDHAKELRELKAVSRVNKKVSFPNWYDNLIKSYESKKPPKTLVEQMWFKYRDNIPPPK